MLPEEKDHESGGDRVALGRGPVATRLGERTAVEAELGLNSIPFGQGEADSARVDAHPVATSIEWGFAIP